jgi:hypothetical protein
VSGKYFIAAVARDRESQVSNYPAQNAFGATVMVRAAKHNRIMVATGVTDMDVIHRPALRISMAPSVARELRAHLELVLVGNLASPYLATHSSYIEPKVDRPVSLIFEDEIIVTDARCAMVRNKITNAALATFEY